jgi:hypothetical protein
MGLQMLSVFAITYAKQLLWSLGVAWIDCETRFYVFSRQPSLLVSFAALDRLYLAQ